jgi:hypothetical protein
MSNIAQKCIESKMNVMCEGRPDRAGSHDNEPYRCISNRRLPGGRCGGRNRTPLYGHPRCDRCDRHRLRAEDGHSAEEALTKDTAGKLRGVKRPGMFLIIPVIDHVVAVIDERIQTAAFSHDAQKAALNITNYREAIDRVSQTSLRVAETSYVDQEKAV